MELHEQLAAGVEALKAGNHSLAAEHLGAVLSDPQFQAQADLMDLRARACSLHAQALLELGRLPEADRQVRVALGLLRRLEDADGQRDVRRLQEQIDAAIAATRPAPNDPRAVWVRSATVEQLLAQATTADQQADLLLKKANAILDDGSEAELGQAIVITHRAIALDPAIRTQVFGRMTLARALPHEAEQWLSDALQRADEADEFNLVGAVSRAARMQGVTLPTASGVSR